jgi:hypothetical protein
MTPVANVVVFKSTGFGVMRLTGWGHFDPYLESNDSLGANYFALEAWERMTEGGLKVSFLYGGCALMTDDGYLWCGKSPFIW